MSRRLPIWSLYERARSLGLAVQVSAQSWHGLAPDDTGRYRIVSAAEGGVWLLRTPHPEPVTGLAGAHPVVSTSRRLTGFARWSREGSSGLEAAPVADPALVRRLDVGQAAYLFRGGATFVQVSPARRRARRHRRRARGPAPGARRGRSRGRGNGRARRPSGRRAAAGRRVRAEPGSR